LRTELTIQEWYTVTAALRRWQNLMEAGEDLEPELSIARINGTVPLVADQIDRLVDRIVEELP
jgi:hypothetical protein